MSLTTEAPVRSAPEVPPLPPLREPDDARRTLPNGLDVWAARRAGAGLSEVRLVIPLGGLAADAVSDAAARLTADLLFTEAAGPVAAEAGPRLARLGFSARASSENASFSISLSGLDETLGEALAIVAAVLNSASFDAEQVGLRATRIASQLGMEGSDPGRIGHDRLRRILFPGHVYGRALSDPEGVASIDAAAADRFRGQYLVPSGSHLIAVSPRPPADVLAEAESAFKVWGGSGEASGEASPVADPPDIDPSGLGSMLVLDRPDSVQTAFWFGTRTSGRAAADHAALAIAVLVLQTRLHDNIRRRHGWTYSAGSQLVDLPKASCCLVVCPVRTEVTLPAYAELVHELNRVVAAPISDLELREATGSLQGRAAQRLGSRSGLAEELARLAESDRTVRSVVEETAALSKASHDEVMETARRWLAPARTARLAIGNAETIAPLLETFGPVRVESS